MYVGHGRVRKTGPIALRDSLLVAGSLSQIAIINWTISYRKRPTTDS